jgi:hypothetical protein
MSGHQRPNDLRIAIHQFQLVVSCCLGVVSPALKQLIACGTRPIWPSRCIVIINSSIGHPQSSHTRKLNDA